MPTLDVPGVPPQTDPGEAHRGKLGRIQDPRDPRDFDARALLEGVRGAMIPLRGERRTYLPPRTPQNQGVISKCVLSACLHRYLGAPHEHRVDPPWDTTAAYHVAQSMDEWAGGEREPARRPGQPYYEGTSVRAGLELGRLGWEGIIFGVRMKLPKWVHSYWRLKRWTDVLDYAAAAEYREGGSIVWGTNWSEGMFKVDADGYLNYDPSQVIGGHATLQYHINIPKNTAGFQNSWGTHPGNGMGPMGRYKTRLEGPGSQRQLFDDDGDAYAVVELGTPLARIADAVIEQGGLT